MPPAASAKGRKREDAGETEGGQNVKNKVATLEPPIVDPRTARSVKPFRVALLKLLNGFDDSIIAFNFDCDGAGKIVQINRPREKAA